MNISGMKTEYYKTLLSDFDSHLNLKVAQMSATKGNLLDVFQNPKIYNQNNHIYNTSCKDSKPISNQHSSGRCWIFSLLNTIRVPLMKSLGIDELELSYNYLFYFDKLERSYYELRLYLKYALAKEEVTGRKVAFALTSPSQDGGQWSMLVNLVVKHGLMPKACFLESSTAECALRLNRVLSCKMRQFCRDIFRLVEEGLNHDQVVQRIDADMFPQVFRIVNVCLGTPPSEFVFEYKKDKEVASIGPITPQEFYNLHVKPVFNMLDKVVLIHDPRPTSVYGDTYTVENLNNMVDGVPVLYLNTELPTIKSAIIKSLKAGEPVWFGSDISKEHNRSLGIGTTQLYRYDLTFGIDALAMSKADRLIFADSFMSHAMVITAAHLIGGDGKPAEKVSTVCQSSGSESVIDVTSPASSTTATSNNDNSTAPTNQSRSDLEESKEKPAPVHVQRWKVENSWGSTYGNSGYMSMWDDWFDWFAYQFVVDRRFLEAETLGQLEKEPHMLAPWDPFGTLAGF